MRCSPLVRIRRSGSGRSAVKQWLPSAPRRWPRPRVAGGHLGGEAARRRDDLARAAIGQRDVRLMRPLSRVSASALAISATMSADSRVAVADDPQAARRSCAARRSRRADNGAADPSGRRPRRAAASSSPTRSRTASGRDAEFAGRREGAADRLGAAAMAGDARQAARLAQRPLPSMMMATWWGPRRRVRSGGQRRSRIRPA